MFRFLGNETARESEIAELKKAIADVRQMAVILNAEILKLRGDIRTIALALDRQNDRIDAIGRGGNEG